MKMLAQWTGRFARSAATPNAAATAGLGMIGVGCYQIYPPLAWLVPGVALFGLSLWGHLRG